MKLGDLWALEGVRSEWVTDFVGLRPLLKLLNELVIDALLDVDSRASTAALAVIEEDTKVDPRDGVLDVGIVEDDVRTLAAKFKRDLLQVRASGGLHDLAANDGAAGEGNFIYVHMGGQGGTGDLAEPGEDVDDTRRETSLFREFGCVESAERGLFGGLEDNGVTTSDGGANLPCPHEKWEVPWNDLSANANLLYGQKLRPMLCKVGLTGSCLV